jgi:hypothetical protein
MTRKPLLIALALAGLGSSAVPVAAQDPGPQPNPDAPPLTATLKAPKSAAKAQLKKGVKVKIACDIACNARFTTTHTKLGIITTTSTDVPAGTGKTVKIKVAKLYLSELRKGQRIQVAVDARTEAGALAQVQKKIKVKK